MGNDLGIKTFIVVLCIQWNRNRKEPKTEVKLKTI